MESSPMLLPHLLPPLNPLMRPSCQWKRERPLLSPLLRPMLRLIPRPTPGCTITAWDMLPVPMATDTTVITSDMLAMLDTTHTPPTILTPTPTTATTAKDPLRPSPPPRLMPRLALMPTPGCTITDWDMLPVPMATVTMAITSDMLPMLDTTLTLITEAAGTATEPLSHVLNSNLIISYLSSIKLLRFNKIS